MRISDWSSDVCSSDLLGEKIVERNAEDEKFEHVFLIDDFTASGTTFIRQVKGKWKGKLQRFNAIVDDARKRLGDEFPIAENYALHIHHYLSTAQEKAALADRPQAANKAWDDRTLERKSGGQGKSVAGRVGHV